MNQFATIIESISPKALQANGVISENTFSLGLFPRALQTSLLFKWFKAEYVEYEYTPQYNLFQEDLTELNPQIPYMYHAMNRTQDANIPPAGLSVEFMESQGCVPIKFTKKIVIRYKPNWCSSSFVMQRLNTNPGTPFLDAIASTGVKCEYGWLSCPDSAGDGSALTTNNIIQPAPATFPANFNIPQNFPQSTVYNGHYTYFSQGPNTSLLNDVCNLTVRVKWVFKNPGFWALGDRATPPVAEVPLETPATQS